MKALIVSTGLNLPLTHCQSNGFTTDLTVFDKLNGKNNWVLLEASELPSDFSVESYTIEGGVLTPKPTTDANN